MGKELSAELWAIFHIHLLRLICLFSFLQKKAKSNNEFKKAASQSMQITVFSEAAKVFKIAQFCKQNIIYLLLFCGFLWRFDRITYDCGIIMHSFNWTKKNRLQFWRIIEILSLSENTKKNHRQNDCLLIYTRCSY